MDFKEKSLFLLIFSFLIGCHPVDQKEYSMTGNLFYKTAGSGPEDIVFLHGLLGSSSYWDGISGKLAPNHHLIMLDLLGFGESEKPKSDYTVHKHLTKIASTLSTLQDSETTSILVGHSMGAFLAMNYAIAFPRKVKKLILINAPMVTSKEGLKKNMAASSSKFMVTMTFSETWGMLVCKLHELFPSFSYPLIRWLEPDLLPVVAKAAGQHTWDSYSGSFKNVLLKQNFYLLLDQVADIPILILTSKSDIYTDEKAIEKVPTRPNIQIVQLEGDHNVLLETPDIISAEILKFLSRP